MQHVHSRNHSRLCDAHACHLSPVLAGAGHVQYSSVSFFTQSAGVCWEGFSCKTAYRYCPKMLIYYFNTLIRFSNSAYLYMNFFIFLVRSSA